MKLRFHEDRHPHQIRHFHHTNSKQSLFGKELLYSLECSAKSVFLEFNQRCFNSAMALPRVVHYVLTRVRLLNAVYCIPCIMNRTQVTNILMTKQGKNIFLKRLALRLCLPICTATRTIFGHRTMVLCLLKNMIFRIMLLKLLLILTSKFYFNKLLQLYYFRDQF